MKKLLFLCLVLFCVNNAMAQGHLINKADVNCRYSKVKYGTEAEMCPACAKIINAEIIAKEKASHARWLEQSNKLKKEAEEREALRIKKLKEEAEAAKNKRVLELTMPKSTVASGKNDVNVPVSNNKVVSRPFTEAERLDFKKTEVKQTGWSKTNPAYQIRYNGEVTYEVSGYHIQQCNFSPYVFLKRLTLNPTFPDPGYDGNYMAFIDRYGKIIPVPGINKFFDLDEYNFNHYDNKPFNREIYVTVLTGECTKVGVTDYRWHTIRYKIDADGMKIIEKTGESYIRSTKGCKDPKVNGDF